MKAREKQKKTLKNFVLLSKNLTTIEIKNKKCGHFIFRMQRGVNES